MQQQKPQHTLYFQEEIPGLGRSIEIELIEMDPPVDSWKDEFLPPAIKENLPWWVKSRNWPLGLKEEDI